MLCTSFVPTGIVDRIASELESDCRNDCIAREQTSDCSRVLGSFEDWIDQFENIAEINHWNDEQKRWLQVRLMAYKNFPVTAHASFRNAVTALQERFEPGSHRDLYLAEFQNSDTQ